MTYEEKCNFAVQKLEAAKFGNRITIPPLPDYFVVCSLNGRRVLMRVLFLSLISILLSACADPCSNEVINHVVDAEKKTTAIHVVRNCGATTGYAHHIYIAATGTDYDDTKPIFVADKVDNLTVSWTAERSLEISYDSARIFNFTNFWQSSEIDNFQYVIKVSLREGAKQSP